MKLKIIPGNSLCTDVRIQGSANGHLAILFAPLIDLTLSTFDNA
jgi:hypothetical protein